MIDKESIGRIDTNNLKALAILKSVLFTLENGGNLEELDTVSALEAVQDILMDTDNILDAI